MKRVLVHLAVLLLALSSSARSQAANSMQDHEQDPLLKSYIPLPRSSAAAASLPRTMSYQGLLSTAAGAPAADGNYDLQFDLYDSSSGGASQWSETQNGLPVHRGSFSVVLGSATPLSPDFNRRFFLEVKALNGPAGPPYPLTFSPRSELTSAPSSLAPWTPNGGDIYYNHGHVGIGTSTPGQNGIGTLHMELADSDGANSDVALRVSGDNPGFPVLNLAKSRGSSSFPTAVNNGDALGGLDFVGYGGSAYKASAAIYGMADSVPAAGAVPSRLAFYTTNGSGSYRRTMTLDRNGYLGIGTATPVANLHVYDATNSINGCRLALTQASGGSSIFDGMAVICTSPNSYVWNYENGFMAFGTNNSYRMFIDSAGRVGMGTTSPSQKLTVAGNICATGSIGTCSDVRYKKDISPLSSALKNVLSLQGVSYHWKTDEFPGKEFPKDRQIGLIAQEVERIYPEVVQTGSDGYKSVDYGRLTPILIEAIKEQQQEIDELKSLVKSLAAGKNRDDEKSTGGSK